MGEKRSNYTVDNVNLEPIEDSLDESFRDVCDEYGYERPRTRVSFRSPDGSKDEVFRRHESFRFSNGTHRSGVVRTVKSSTAREMWEQHKPFLEEYLWSGGFWEESYYVGTAGHVSTDATEQCIERTEHV
jgi:putative transposase